MAKQGLPIVTHDLSIVQPGKELAYPIPVSDWEFLRKKVDSIDSDAFISQTIGSLFLGVGATALITALTVPDNQGSKPMTFWWATMIVTSICGAVFLWNASQDRTRVKSNKASAIEEMDRMKNRYIRPADVA
jgi:hypothetical protein